MARRDSATRSHAVRSVALGGRSKSASEKRRERGGARHCCIRVSSRVSSSIGRSRGVPTEAGGKDTTSCSMRARRSPPLYRRIWMSAPPVAVSVTSRSCRDRISAVRRTRTYYSTTAVKRVAQAAFRSSSANWAMRQTTVAGSAALVGGNSAASSASIRLQPVRSFAINGPVAGLSNPPSRCRLLIGVKYVCREDGARRRSQRVPKKTRHGGGGGR